MFFVIRLKKVILFLMVILAIFLYYTFFKYIPTIATPVTNKVIIIDAGHGGFDPGAIGKTGTLEKEINLQIAEKLQILLEQNGSLTVITRADDSELGRNKKKDMQSRRVIRDSNEGDIFVSIHLNSFPSENCKGAQTFYPKDEKSKKLAEFIQKNLKEIVDNGNMRVSKELTDVYLLKNITIPSVIVECGFLSNGEEEILLKDEKYQSKIAMAIYMGIIEYFSEIK